MRLLRFARNDPLHRHCEEPLATKQSYPSAYDYEIATLTSFARNDWGRSVKRDYAKLSE